MPAPCSRHRPTDGVGLAGRRDVDARMLLHSSRNMSLRELSSRRIRRRPQSLPRATGLPPRSHAVEVATGQPQASFDTPEKQIPPRHILRPEEIPSTPASTRRALAVSAPTGTLRVLHGSLLIAGHLLLVALVTKVLPDPVVLTMYSTVSSSLAVLGKLMLYATTGCGSSATLSDSGSILRR